MQFEKYSIFEDLRKVNSNKSKKVFIESVKDFISVVKAVINKNNKSFDDKLSNEKEIELLMYIGLIKSAENYSLLLSLLGEVYIDLYNSLKLFNNHLESGEIDSNIGKFCDSYRKNAVNDYMKDLTSPTLVDFFSGAGGLSLGFKREGFKILLANDIEPTCTNTYSFNHYEMPMDRIVTGDIKNIVVNIENYITEKVDVIVGGPPCQGFSMANRQRLIDDPRNILYRYYVQAVEKLKPKLFVMENVKGMTGVANQVVDDFHTLESVDYFVSYKLFNAKKFGIPQNRERLFYVGVRSDIAETFSVTPLDILDLIEANNEKFPKYVLEDAIKDLRVLDASQLKNSTISDSETSGKRIEQYEYLTKDNSNYLDWINQKETMVLYNHKARYNNSRDIEIFSRMHQGDKSDSERIADIMPYSSRSHMFKDKYYKLRGDEVCKTITAHMKFDCNMYIHPTQSRGLTPREAARIQTYPDDYFFLGAYTKTYMQIGNSVPPLLSNAIAKVLKNYIG